VSTDGEVMAAVAGLRAALIGGAGVGEALRLCCYRHPSFMSTLLTESVRERFGPNCDIRDITRFVARVAAGRDPAQLGFPRREAEAVIRAVLGELNFLDEVDPAQFSYIEIGIAVMTQLFAEWRPDPVEMASLFARAEAVLAEARAMSPVMDEVERDWQASDMPNSPFAFPI
jgi:hypothetical protein